MDYTHLTDVDFAGKKALVRVDFNVPLDDDGMITNDTRIVAALPTLQHILDANGALIIMSHLGRPKGEVVEKLRMNRVAECLSKHLGKSVKKIDSCVGEEATAAATALQPGEVLLLENLRFDAREKKGDDEFAQQLASLADVYVNDAFGTCHRAHASVVQITKHLPACAGLLVQKEIDAMLPVVENPKKPYIAILGGAKISDKLKLIHALLPRVDKLLIGGAMAFTFLRAMGDNVGRSLVQADFIETARELLTKYPDTIVLPIDVVVAKRFAADASHKTVLVQEIPIITQALDIGEATVQLFSTLIQNAQTVVWNGPMGVFEFEAFAKGTEGVARAVAGAHATTIVGGGDSLFAVTKLGLIDNMTHVSTGGGATLELFESGSLPALQALEENHSQHH